MLRGLKAAVTMETTPPQIVCIHWLVKLLVTLEAPFPDSGGTVLMSNEKFGIFPMHWINSTEFGGTYLSIPDIIKLLERMKSFDTENALVEAWNGMIKTFSEMEKESKAKAGGFLQKQTADYYPSPSLN